MSKSEAVTDEQLADARRWLDGLVTEAEQERTIEKAIKELKPEIMRMRSCGYSFEKISEGLHAAGINAAAHAIRRALGGKKSRKGAPQ